MSGRLLLIFGLICVVSLPLISWGVPPPPPPPPPAQGDDSVPQTPQENPPASEGKANYKGEEAGKAFVNFLGWLFSFLLSVAAISALIVIILAGFKWIASAGNPSTISDAKDMIMKAVIGLVLAFASWLILNTINPNLVGGILPGGGGGGDEETPGTVFRCESPDSANRNTGYSSPEACAAGCALKQGGGSVSNPICNEVPEDEPDIVFQTYICETTQDTGEGNSYYTPEICGANCGGGQSACAQKPAEKTWMCGGNSSVLYWTQNQCGNWCFGGASNCTQ